MKVRVNFTIDIDPDEYRAAYEVGDDKVEIRRTIQDRSISDVVLGLADAGVPCRLVGRNNVYDPRRRITVGEGLTRLE